MLARISLKFDFGITAISAVCWQSERVGAFVASCGGERRGTGEPRAEWGYCSAVSGLIALRLFRRL
jgi:hypothetical protein